MIGIIDYGLGNVLAFENIYKSLNIQVKIIKFGREISSCNKLILPGVGSFDHAIALLNESGMLEDIIDAVLIKKIPILGVCIGMQILANFSMEGVRKGLGWIDGEVVSFESIGIDENLKLPQIGWNIVEKLSNNKLFEGLDDGKRFYFLHSFFYKCSDDKNSIAVTNYGIKFTSAICKNNIYGVQFHPEKSHKNGIKLLSNFARL